ncbi:MAG: hypothetical protein Q4A37_02985, partial [Candidatus Saccharibacteria bacterium]|nr:hypothetical protein [Candidatus Saccharibacteria bacterium]
FNDVLRGGDMDDFTPPEITCPQRCENCPVVAGIQSQIARAAMREYGLASFVMSNDEPPAAAQELLAGLTGQSIDEARDELLRGLMGARRQAADNLAKLDNMVQEGQDAADSFTQDCSGVIMLSGENSSQRVLALTCGSPSMMGGGDMAFGEEHLFVARKPRRGLRDVIRQIRNRKKS